MYRKFSPNFKVVILSVLIAPMTAQAGHDASGDHYSPFIVKDTAQQVYWGDTHLHTSYSADAGMIGNTLGPEQAYRFALGHEITTSSGQKARLVRPLDFLVISDHAENLGLAPMIAESNEELLKSENGKKMHDLVKDGKGHDAFMFWIIPRVCLKTAILSIIPK